MSSILNLSIIAVVLRVMTPILLSATGGIYSERVGATNISLEGSMLFAAFTGVIASYLSGNIFIAILSAVMGSILVNLLFGLIHIRLGGDNVITGLAINTLCLGLTTFLLKSIFNLSGTLMDPRIVGLKKYTVPILSEIPVIQHFFTNQTILVYLSIVLVIFTEFVLTKTQFGMNLRACGENPSAAAAIGIDITRKRFQAVMITGIFTGLAGAQISLGYLTMFSENMTAGRGFIALAAVILSKAKPKGVLITSLIFGLAEAISNQFQLTNISSFLVLMIPYIVVILTLIFQPDRIKSMKEKLTA